MKLSPTSLCTWAEMTTAEQREAAERGFPRDRNIRYEVKRRYADNDWKLVRWTRVSPTSDRAYDWTNG